MWTLSAVERTYQEWWSIEKDVESDSKDDEESEDHIYTLYRFIDLVDRVFANGPGDLGSIPGRVIPKTLKMVLDTSLLNTQQYKVRTKGKVERSRERSNTLPYTPV